MKTIPHSPLEPSARAKWFAGIVVIGYAIVSLIPLVWIFMTSFRTPQDAIAYPPKVVTEQSLIGYVNLFTTRSRVSQEELAALPPPATWYEGLVREQQMILAGPSRFIDRYSNSPSVRRCCRSSWARWPPTPSRAFGCRARTTCCSSSCRHG